MKMTGTIRFSALILLCACINTGCTVSEVISADTTKLDVASLNISESMLLDVGIINFDAQELKYVEYVGEMRSVPLTSVNDWDKSLTMEYSNWVLLPEYWHKAQHWLSQNVWVINLNNDPGCFREPISLVYNPENKQYVYAWRK